MHDNFQLCNLKTELSSADMSEIRGLVSVYNQASGPLLSTVSAAGVDILDTKRNREKSTGGVRRS